MAAKCAKMPLKSVCRRVNILKDHHETIAAPEIQHKSMCNSSSDIFSLGMLMVSVFNGGHSLIPANYSTNLYFKYAGLVRLIAIIIQTVFLKPPSNALQYLQLDNEVRNILPQIPAGIQDAIREMVNQDTRYRPCAKTLSGLQYFK